MSSLLTRSGAQRLKSIMAEWETDTAEPPLLLVVRLEELYQAAEAAETVRLEALRVAAVLESKVQSRRSSQAQPTSS
jgi:hypothetical protein